jgi:hypothetical protein
LLAIASRRMPSDAISSQRMRTHAIACKRKPMSAKICQNDLSFSFPKSQSSIKLYLYIYLLSFIYGGQKAPVYRCSRSLVGRFLAEVRRFLGDTWDVFSKGNPKLGGF